MLRRTICRSVYLVIIVIPGAFAQTAVTASAATGSIAGRMLSEDGRNVRGMVVLQPSAARGFPSPPRRVMTRNDGSFSFSKLPAGAYSLCAQIPDFEAQRSTSTPFLDTCSWGSVHPPITLSGGQQATAVSLTAPKGVWLKIRVADPDKVLPAVAAVGPSVLEPALQLIVRGADQIGHHARFVSADSNGRNYQLVVPVNAALKLSLASSTGSLFDQTGAAVKTTDTVSVQASAGVPLGVITFTIHKGN